MKPKYWILIILASLATAACAAYYISQPALDGGLISVHHSSKNVTSTVPLVATSTAATSTVTGISGWNTYTNSRYGFSFEFPHQLVVFSDNGDVTFLQDSYASQLHIWLFPEISDPTYYPSEQFPPVKLSKKTINGRNWYFTSYKDPDCIDDGIYQTNLPSGGTIQVEFDGCLGKAYKEFGVLQDASIRSKILSSFKFTK